MKEFNGWSFGEKKMRSKMKYIVILEGDLDLNNAYAFTNHKGLKKFIAGEFYSRRITAIFKVKDVTDFYSRPNNPSI